MAIALYIPPDEVDFFTQMVPEYRCLGWVGDRLAFLADGDRIASKEIQDLVESGQLHIEIEFGENLPEA